jgi:hypothetical protein
MGVCDCVNRNTGVQNVDICGTLVSVSEYGRNSGKVEANSLNAKIN